MNRKENCPDCGGIPTKRSACKTCDEEGYIMSITAEVMTEEEAMKLPVEKRPLCYRISSEMYHTIFEEIGAATMCWEPRPNNQGFRPEEASDCAVRLAFKVAGEMESRSSELAVLASGALKLAKIYHVGLLEITKKCPGTDAAVTAQAYLDLGVSPEPPADPVPNAVTEEPSAT